MSKIKALILCGGQGTRIRDVSEILPKPMLPVGNKPMLWHIMKLYAHYGIKDFILCLGYKGWVVKEFFLNYAAKLSDISLTIGKHESVIYHTNNDEVDWKITLAETGEGSQTGARIWNVRDYLEDCEVFSVTYGDGMGDINIKNLVETHKKSGLLGTITGVHPSGRFGEMEIADNAVTQFNEKPNVSTGLINGGYMMFEKDVLKRYFRNGEDLILESEVLTEMVKDKQLGVYQHEGFWQCVDTPREHKMLNNLWDEKKAPWKVW